MKHGTRMQTDLTATCVKARARGENFKPDREAKAKQRYNKPTITAYDDLTEVTSAVSDMAARSASGENATSVQLPAVDTKKPYRKPRLKVYGNIQTLTATVGLSMTIDGGSGAMNRTS